MQIFHISSQDTYIQNARAEIRMKKQNFQRTWKKLHLFVVKVFAEIDC